MYECCYSMYLYLFVGSLSHPSIDCWFFSFHFIFNFFLFILSRLYHHSAVDGTFRQTCEKYYKKKKNRQASHFLNISFAMQMDLLTTHHHRLIIFPKHIMPMFSNMVTQTIMFQC